MKIKIFITILLAGVLIAAYFAIPPDEPATQIENEQALKFAQEINKAIAAGERPQEIEKTIVPLPKDIHEGQIQKYFQLDDMVLALVQRSSMNVILSLPDDFTPSFVGVLVAEQGGSEWTKLLEIKDEVFADKNNPYYLTVVDNELMVTIVDQNGAGSGEGKMKVRALSNTNEWKLVGCYYFGESYSDAARDGDYYAYSAQFFKQSKEPLESCIAPSEGNAKCILSLKIDSLRSSESGRAFMEKIEKQDIFQSATAEKDFQPIELDFHPATKQGEYLLGMSQENDEIVVNEAHFSDLVKTDATSLEKSIEIGKYIKTSFEELSPREIGIFLLKSRLITTYWHLRSQICMKREEDTEKLYKANFEASHDYCTNECVTKEYSFALEIDKSNGSITILPK